MLSYIGETLEEFDLKLKTMGTQSMNSSTNIHVHVHIFVLIHNSCDVQSLFFFFSFLSIFLSIRIEPDNRQTEWLLVMRVFTQL